MRKLFFVLLCITLIALIGCQSENTPDAAVSSPAASQENTSAISSADTTYSGSAETSGNFSSDKGQPTQAEASSPLAESSDTPSRPQEKPASPTETKPAIPEQTKPPKGSGGSSSPPSLPSHPSAESTPTAPSASEPSEPAASKPPETTSQPEQNMEAEYARIIRETVAYAKGYTAKGFTFIWDDSLEFSWEGGVGWMGTPRIKYEGVDGTIEMLKYHVDKIVKTVTDPNNGIPGYSMFYKVMQVMVDGDIAFVVLYA